MSAADTELVLAVVDAAGQAVAPDEHRDLFDDYAHLLRTTRVLPGAIAQPDRATPITKGADFSGIGLALLGRLGGRLLTIAAGMAAETGLSDAPAFVRELLRRGDQDALEALAERTVATTTAPREADRAVLMHVVLVQITVLGSTQVADPDDV
jgi:hypothetical protein